MRVEANELHGTDVKLVSLVKRGANRLPWRITKQDGEDMLDISKYFKKAETSASGPVPAIHSAIMCKDAKDAPALTATLAKAGIDVSKPVDQGDFIVFAQKDGDPSADAVLIKSNSNVGFVIENLSKSFSGYDFSSNEFNDVFATGSFCPSVAMASDLMGVTIGNILSTSDTPGDASAKIAKAVEGFKQYAVTLANSLPVQAFKADKMLKGDVGMTLHGSGSTSHNATMDDKNNTAVNIPKPSKSLESSEAMAGFKDGMKRSAGAGSTNIKDAISVGTENDAGKGTQTDATEDDKKAVFQGNNVTGKGGKNPNIPTKKAEEIERLQKSAGEAAAAGDHETASVLYSAAVNLSKAGGKVDDEVSEAQKLKDSQSGAGAQSSNTGAHVKKADQVTKEQVTAIVATLRKSAEAYKAVGLIKRADAVSAEADALEKADVSMVTDGNGTSRHATEDDANNTAVGATKKKPDPNLENPDHLDPNGWSSKIAAENKTMFAELTKSLTGAVNAAVESVRKEVTGLAAQVATIGGRIEKAEAAVNGTVFAEPRSDMLGFRRQKSEDGDGAPPPLDTGLRKYEEAEPTISDIRKFAKRGRNW